MDTYALSWAGGKGGIGRESTYTETTRHAELYFILITYRLFHE